MYRLALDSSNGNLTLALSADDQMLASLDLYPCKAAAEKLTPALDQLLMDANCHLSDINNILVVTGPGGFSGLRVTLSFVHGLTCTHPHIKMGSVSSLLAIAASGYQKTQQKITANQNLAACLRCAQDGYYYQDFTIDLQPLCQPCFLNSAELASHLANTPKPTWLWGHGSAHIKSHLPADHHIITDTDCPVTTAKGLAYITTHHQHHICNTLSPIYIRGPL